MQAHAGRLPRAPASTAHARRAGAQAAAAGRTGTARRLPPARTSRERGRRAGHTPCALPAASLPGCILPPPRLQGLVDLSTASINSLELDSRRREGVGRGAARADVRRSGSGSQMQAGQARTQERAGQGRRSCCGMHPRRCGRLGVLSAGRPEGLPVASDINRQPT